MLTLSHDKLRIFCLILLSHLLLTQTSTAQTTAAQNAGEAAARQATSSVLIRWQGKPGVERYRLQLATDARFNDIVFDQAVVGRQHVVKELTPGRYYWRVAPAAKETGAYSRATEVVVVASNVVAPADLGGWRTATGEVLRPVSAQLRAGGVVDLVGVNREGTTYAIDGANGVTLWSARYRPDAGAEKS